VRRVALIIALMASVAADAAEPAAGKKPVAAVHPTVVAAPKPAPIRPLDLRIHDVRNYMMPDEYRDALGAPDADNNTVVVQANQPLLPMKFERPVPGGIMAPFWALAHPLQSWRILAPDLNAPEAPRPNPIPPPVFRWGP